MDEDPDTFSESVDFHNPFPESEKKELADPYSGTSEKILSEFKAKAIRMSEESDSIFQRFQDGLKARGFTK